MRRRLFAIAWCGGLAAAGAAAGQPLTPVAAETSLELNLHLLEDLGVEARFRQPVGEAGGFVRAIFPAAAPALRVRAPGGSFAGFDGGALRHPGGFDLVWPGGVQSLRGFELAPAAAGAPGEALFELRAADGSVPLLLSPAHPVYLAELGQIDLLNMDLRLSESFAQRLGVPGAAGLAVGSADVRLALGGPPAATRGAACESNVGEGLDVDVELSLLFGLAEVHHADGKVAMAPYVELRNLGPSDVEWYRPIYPDGGMVPGLVGPHPFLALSLYRLADGAMHQIGRADAKHAFFAANSDCPCPGSQILFAGCRDLYQAVTNYSRMNLGPRHEITASTGAWESLGSHFDGVPVDDERSHAGDPDHADPFEHRLTVAEEDLSTPGARYFIEAWYVTPGDVDIFNSMGRREVVPQFGGSWTFPFADTEVTQGATLDAWIDPAAPPPGAAATLLDTGEGRVELASSGTPLAGGATRYDYGLMNFDFDRRLRSFSVPLPAGVELASIGFHDGDFDPGNDWQATVTAGAITWSTPAGDPALGALDWGTLYSFRFDANAAPVDPMATMEVLEAGSPSALTAAAKGPGGALVPVNRLEVAASGSGSGTVTSSPAGIGCGADCEELYAVGAAVELAASAVAGSALIRWTEGGAPLGTADTQQTLLDVDRSLVAVFELCDRQLAPQVVDDQRTFEACDTLAAGAGFEIAATGSAALRAGSTVRLDEGFILEAGGELALENDAALLP